MDRRKFIENTGTLCLSALLPISTYSMPVKNKYKLGLQLFSIHQDMTKDTVSTLKAAKAMGYEDFETFVFND